MNCSKDTKHKSGLDQEDEQSTKKAKVEVDCSENASKLDLKKLAIQLVEARPDLIPELTEFSNTSESVQPDTQGHDLNNLLRFGFKELQMIIAWARKTPGFDGLQMNDRVAVLKSSFMDLSVLRLSFRSIETLGHLKFTHDFIMTIDESVEIGWNYQVVAANLEFVQRLRSLNFDLTEFCILSAVVLLYPDAVGIIDKAMVTSLQNRMLDCLYLYCTTRYPNNVSRYGKIIICLSALRTISANALQHFVKLSKDGRIEMDALVSELMS